MSKPSITAGKSFRSGCVAVRIAVRAHGTYDRASIAVQSGVDIPTREARELAAVLIARADEADAKVAKTGLLETRRNKWRDREIAAGRMKVMTW